MGYTPQLADPLGLLLLFCLAFLLHKLVQAVTKRRNSPSALLRGPPNTSFLFGRQFESLYNNDDGALIEQWAKDYGAVFKLPTGFGGAHVVLCDPKAIAHFHAKDGFTYLRMPFAKALMESLIGHNMITTDKDDHRRQRRIMTPAFSNAILRGTLDAFYDSAYKVKEHWGGSFESSSEVVIDIQEWMNKLSLDIIGVAGFGHNFRSIEGHKSAATEAFESFDTASNPKVMQIFIRAGQMLPQLAKIPAGPSRSFNKLQRTLSEMATQLLDASRRQMNGSEGTTDRSILGLLLKEQSDTKNVKLSHDEIVGQGLFLFAGYETTSISLAWALVELSRHPSAQEKLRQELQEFSDSDPTWDQLTSGLPYLDAVANETLRLHPPVEEVTRMAGEDDTIPLSTPLKLASGRTVDSIFIPRGTVLMNPVVSTNLCEAFWGPDARQYVPERWLANNPCKAKELVGYKKLYTFSDGPRMCIGKVFAVTEFKAALSVLIRNLAFELPNGPETKVYKHRSSLLLRPKLENNFDLGLPLRVKQVAK